MATSGAELGDENAWIRLRLLAKANADQTQEGGPTLCALDELVDNIGLDGHAIRVTEEAIRLGDIEAEGLSVDP